MDMVLAQFFFVNAVRLARLGASASAVASVATVWGVVYLIGCQVVGKVLTIANSTRLLLSGGLLMAGLSLLHLLFTSTTGIYVLMGCSGIAAALFFPAFQVFMKAVDAGQATSIAYSTGLYTFAWSMGFAVGPFIAGFLIEYGTSGPGEGGGAGWRLAFLFGAVASLLAVGLITLLKHLRKNPPAAAKSRATEPSPLLHPPIIDYARMPDLAWLGWLSAGVGVTVLSVIRGVFPARAVAALRLSASVQGTIFFLLSLTQACVGLAGCRSRLWMYHARPVVMCGLAGAVGTVCLGYGTTLPILYAGAILFGLYSGAFFFYLVFHSLAHPKRSAQYVAINESAVGVGGIAGPLLGGFLADWAGFGSAYLTGAILILVVITVQAVAHRRHPVSSRSYSSASSLPKQHLT